MNILTTHVLRTAVAVGATLWVVSNSGLAYAQDAAPATAEATTEAPAVESAPVEGGSGVAADLAALRAEVDGLKAKAEEAELAALMAATEEAPAEEAPALRIYGFADFGMDKAFFDSGDDSFALLRQTPASTFVFGNLNLYFDASPVEHIRTLLELRFTLAPHGEETSLGPPLGTSYERVDTLAFDFSAPSAQTQLRLGGLFIERAWSQYEVNEAVKIQWGLFLNPFGIWNIDHGSPTLISLMLPTFVAAQMMPTRLLGVNVYGSTISGSTELGYAVHVTNGRSPTDWDLTEDKAIGARLYAAHEGDFGRLVIGTSGYYGTYADVEKVIALQGDNVFNWESAVEYTEAVVGVDAALDLGDLRFRGEGVFRWVNYEDGKHETLFSTGGPQQYLPNRLEYAAYAMLAYRTPWKLEPYVEIEVSSKAYVMPRFAGKSRATSSDVAAAVPSVGLNYEVAPQMLIKAQLAWVAAYDTDYTGNLFVTPIAFLRVVNSF